MTWNLDPWILIGGILLTLFGLFALNSKKFDDYVKKSYQEMPWYMLPHWNRSYEGLRTMRRWDAKMALIVGLFLIALYTYGYFYGS